jgi:hypothetical protein
MNTAHARRWRKSTYSNQDADACVEIATSPTTVHVRDSKVTAGPELCLTPRTWSALTGWLRAS